MWKRSPLILITILYKVIALVSDEDYWDSLEQSIEDPDYGKTWIFMPDGDGLPRIAILAEQPDSTRAGIDNRINFYLYTRNNTREGKELVAGEPDLSLFDPKLWTIFVIHGWQSSEDKEAIARIRRNYVQSRRVNVITVDWRQIASNLFYLECVRKTRDVGRAVADLIDYLCEHHNASPSRMHIIGHSLGAHTAGYAGSYVGCGQVARVTGLDPAGPGFMLSGPETRLDPTDALFVDVIHTAAGSAGHVGLLGHVDFFPNGGIQQPGCGKVHLLKEACSHSKSQYYYSESILDPNFYGYKCSSFQELKDDKCDLSDMAMMGENTSTDSRGKYYVEVSAVEPFGAGPHQQN